MSTDGRRFERMRRRVTTVRFRQQHVIFGVLVLVIAGLIVGPIVTLFITGFQETSSGGAVTGYGFGNFIKAFGASDTWRLLVNTLLYAVGSVALGLFLASGISWLTERTNLPGRRFIRIVMFGAMAVPPLVLAFGWILLLNQNNGVFNVWFSELFGSDQGPFNVYSLPMMIVVTGTSYAPTMFVMLSGVMRNMDSQLQSAGSISGANGWGVTRYVTFPLLRPGIMSVAVYMFMMAVQAVETPLAIGLTAGVPVVSTRIYLLAAPVTELPDYGVASAFGIGLLAFAAVLMVAYYRMIRQSERFTVVSGKGYRPDRSKLGRLRYLALLFVSGYFFLMLAPVFVLAWNSLLPYYQVPSMSALGQLSFHNYHTLINNSLVRTAAKNTVYVVLVTATVTMLIASLVSWIGTRSKSRSGKLLEAFAFSPIAIPQIVLATALLALYLRTPLYGSLTIIILGLITAYLPFATRTMSSVFLQVSEELERAATVSGASPLKAFTRVLLPLLIPQFLDAWLWVLANSIRELTLALTLFTGANILIAPLMWEMWNYPDLSGASALGMLMILASLVIILPVQLRMQRSENRLARRMRKRGMKAAAAAGEAPIPELIGAGAGTGRGIGSVD